MSYCVLKWSFFSYTLTVHGCAASKDQGLCQHALSAAAPHLAAQLLLSQSLRWLVSLQAMYSWWQYELCDWFIELMKQVMARSSSEDGADADRQAFRETLWICLDSGLRCGAMY